MSRRNSRGHGMQVLFVPIVLCLLSYSVVGAQKAVDKPSKPPRGAIVLFDGQKTDAWVQRAGGGPCAWKIVDGALEVTPGQSDILTKAKFGDFQLHIEFNVPDMPDAKDQAKGNSGVYLHGLYEIQILDSFNNGTYATGMCGAIYGQKPPDINACKPAGQWQTYDIVFRAPRFDTAGKVTANPRVTARHNGILIHDDVEITIGATTASLGGAPVATGPILLQNHGCAVRFRNIWLKPLAPSK